MDGEYWIFSDGFYKYDKSRKLEVGVWQMTPEHPVYGCDPCADDSMGAFKWALDALINATGALVGLCDLRGAQYTRIKSVWDRDTSITYALERRINVQADSSMVLHQFGIWVAQTILTQLSYDEELLWDALKEKIRWVCGGSSSDLFKIQVILDRIHEKNREQMDPSLPPFSGVALDLTRAAIQTDPIRAARDTAFIASLGHIHAEVLNHDLQARLTRLLKVDPINQSSFG